MFFPYRRSQIDYFRPKCLTEALEFLSERPGETSVIAGGTDLMIRVRNGELKSRFVMDVSRLDELRHIKIDGNFLEIGAAVTYTELTENPLVKQNAPVLALAAATVGSLQIRNVGTLGGNVGNASPAADGVPPLVVHEARVRIASPSGERTASVQDIILGPNSTSLSSDEIIVSFRLQALPHYRSSYVRIARRRAMSIARINAALIARIENDRVEDIRLSVGSITPRPCRMFAAEDCLRGGSTPKDVDLQAACEAVSIEMLRQSGERSSMEYKKPAVKGLVLKALMEIFS